MLRYHIMNSARYEIKTESVIQIKNYNVQLIVKITLVHP